MKEKGKQENNQTYGETCGVHIKGLLSSLTGNAVTIRAGFICFKHIRDGGVGGKKKRKNTPSFQREMKQFCLYLLCYLATEQLKLITPVSFALFII